MDRAAAADWIREHLRPAGPVELADAGRPVSERGFDAWVQAMVRALPPYAELQRGEAAHAREHLAHGVPDLRLATWPGLAGAFGLAISAGAFVHAFAWARQRDALLPGARPGFDRWFAVILRRAIVQITNLPQR